MLLESDAQAIGTKLDKSHSGACLSSRMLYLGRTSLAQLPAMHPCRTGALQERPFFSAIGTNRHEAVSGARFSDQMLGSVDSKASLSNQVLHSGNRNAIDLTMPMLHAARI